MSEPFLGQLLVVPYNFAPYQWSFCWGQSMQVSQNQALYSLLGAQFGGSGQTSFNLPDLRGRFVVGAGQAATWPGTPTVKVGEAAGSAQQQLSPNQLPPHNHPATFTGTGGGGPSGSASASGNVTLPLTGSVTNGQATVTGSLIATNALATTDVPQAGMTLADVQPGTGTRIYAPAPTTTAAQVALSPISSAGGVTGQISGTATGTVTLPVTGGGGGITGGTVTVGPNTTQSQAISMLPPYLAMNCIISMSGVYPTKD